VWASDIKKSNLTQRPIMFKKTTRGFSRFLLNLKDYTITTPTISNNAPLKKISFQMKNVKNKNIIL